MMSDTTRRSALAIVALLSATGTARADEHNAPENCPYCEGDAERMAQAGIASHGGFAFGALDTNGVDELLSDAEIYWIESEHFKLGLAVGSHTVAQDEKKKIRAELTRLAEVLPEVNPKQKVLDPWLRTHLFAQRLEDLWKDMLAILKVSADDFPPPGTKWIVGTPYFGEGPYLGQSGKYETIALPNADVQVVFLHRQFGLQIRNTQKWNILERDALLTVTNLTENDIYGDAHLHNVIVFNTVHNLVDGYKHYSYETPLWIKEGLAHALERRLEPRYNSFSFGEGSIANKVTKKDWSAEVKKRAQRDAMPTLAEVSSLRTFSEFEDEHHLACWSMTEFLLQEHADAFARINARLHGRKGPDNYPDGTDMAGAQRDAFKDELGMSYAAFDAAWREWAVTR